MRHATGRVYLLVEVHMSQSWHAHLGHYAHKPPAHTDAAGGTRGARKSSKDVRQPALLVLARVDGLLGLACQWPRPRPDLGP